MQEIVGKYDTGGTPYLLPVIKDMEKEARRQYRNAAHLVNAKLRKLGERLGLNLPLTTYVARHAWASIARSKKRSAVYYQRGDGARFGEHHPHLSGFAGHFGGGQGKQSYPEVAMIP